jgi:molybdopterin-guanine dinucleotide biosynthesis protein MobB
VIETLKPMLGVVAYSGTGKTTLLKQLLPWLSGQGVRVGMIKHAHHSFEVDHPGKDSFELRTAGADQVLVASANRWALMVEKRRPAEPLLREMVRHLDQQTLDLILVEGFKHEVFPKIELFRAACGHDPLYPDDPDIVAVASDAELPSRTELPVLDLNDHEQIGSFILGWLAKGHS